jgi:hypothetical protein
LSNRFSAAVALTYAMRRTSSEIRGAYPHPFFFNTPREATTTVDDLGRRELGGHVSAMVHLPMRGQRHVVVFGGPSFFSAHQDLVATATVRESYPYDDVAIDGTTRGSRHVTAIGFHIGGDLSWYFRRRLGVGALVRFSRATTSQLTLGGLQAGGGVRWRF